MTFDALSVPKFIHYKPRVLANVFANLFETDRYQIYAKMSADLEDDFGIEVSVATVKADFCRLRRFVVANKDFVKEMCATMKIRVAVIECIIESTKYMKRGNKGIGRGMRQMCREMINNGVTEHHQMMARLRTFASEIDLEDRPSENCLAATASAVRREFGLSDNKFYRPRSRAKLRIAA